MTTASSEPTPTVPTADRTHFPERALRRNRTVSLHAATVAELAVDTAQEALAAHRSRWPELHDVIYVAHPDPAICTRAWVCRPLPAPPPAVTGGLTHRPGHLHHHSAVPLDDGEATRLLALLDLVADLICAAHARDLLDCRAVSEQRRADQITSALETNRTIGMAMGVLMALHRVTEGQAFDMLRSASQSQNRKLRDIAADVVHTGQLPDDSEEEDGDARARQHAAGRPRHRTRQTVAVDSPDSFRA